MIGVNYQGGKVLWCSTEEWETMAPYWGYTNYLFSTLLEKPGWANLFHTLQNIAEKTRGVLKLSTRATRFSHRMKISTNTWYLGNAVGLLFLLSKEEVDEFPHYPRLLHEDWSLLDSRSPDRGQTRAGMMLMGQVTNFFTTPQDLNSSPGVMYTTIFNESWEKAFPGIFPPQRDLSAWNAKARRVVEGFVRSKVPYGTVAKLLGVSE